MSVVKIPRSAEGVTKELGQIGELLTATEWTRAALLASVVRLDSRGGDRRSSKRGTAFETPDEFAARGIKGLRSSNTVRLYVQRWLDANDGDYPELGKSVTLPDDEWPPTRTGTDGFESDEGARRTIAKIVEKHGAEAVAEAVVDDPRIDNAISRTRIDRVSTSAERRGQAIKARARKAAMEEHIAGNRAALADEMQHQAELEVMGARMHLRRGVKALEAAPYVSESQAEDLSELLSECEHLIELIRQGASSWNAQDRRFLAGIGVDGGDA